MAVEKTYRCDGCGSTVSRWGALRRFVLTERIVHSDLLVAQAQTELCVGCEKKLKGEAALGELFPPDELEKLAGIVREG